jgi:Cytochrome c
MTVSSGPATRFFETSEVSMRRIVALIPILGSLGLWLSSTPCRSADAPDQAAAERGRVAITSTGYLKPSWSADAYTNVFKLWNGSSPDPAGDPEGYAREFNRRYGLAPAPYPNDGLPMGLRRGNGPDGTKVGLAIDCMICHGGSIGGISYVGLGNTQLDLKLLFQEMLKADGKRLPPSTFVINSSRGTVNAGMFSVILLSLRNPDLSLRYFPLPLGASLPELDVPAWWLLGKKSTMYYDGRTDARSVRTNMQFMLGEKTLAQFKELEPTFRDVQAYFKSLKPPQYPFAIDAEKASRGETIFAKNCAKCHGTYGPDPKYPNRIVELKEIGTDPARALGIAPRFVAHYNSTWFGEDFPVDEELIGYQAPPLDGIWATAPYLHNGSVPTLHALLSSAERPARFLRPPSTDFANYDQRNVGWKFDLPTGPNGSASAIEKGRSLFDSSRFGLGNGGHAFGDRLPEDQRMDVIEYLKTL